MKSRSIPAYIVILFGLLIVLPVPWHASASRASLVSRHSPAVLSDPADWPMYGHDPQRTNYNPAESTISPSNVNSLVQRWAFNLGSSSPTSGAPSVTNGRVYAGSSITTGNNYFALDAVTGAGIWSTSVGHGNNCFNVGIGSSAAVSGTVLSVGGGDQAFYGLDTDTGGQLWREPMNVGSSGFPWASPLLAYGRSYLGMASCADNPSVRGELRAIDMTTGSNLGSQYFVPAGYRGAGIWNSPALSPDGSALVVATGEDYAGYNGPYNRAIVSLDPLTLAIMQSNQQGGTGGDLDYATTPLFFSDSMGRTLVGALHKNGTFYAYELNTINNGPIWSRSMGGYSAGMMPAYDPTFGAGGTLFVATASRLYAMDPQTGQDRWAYISVSGLRGNMAIANGLIFLNVAGSLQIRSETNNGTLLRTITPPVSGSTYTGPIVSHGFVYWLSGAWLNAWSLPDVETPTGTPTPVPSTATSTNTANTVIPTSTTTNTSTREPATPTSTATEASPTVAGSTPTSTITRTSTATQTPSPTATVTPCPMTFSDVQTSDWFYEFVNCLYCRGAISGYGDGTFRPYNNTTRGQMCKIVIVAFNYPIYTPPTPTFTDVPANHTFYVYIETAAFNQIVSGYSDGTFRPQNDVTRGQLSKIVVVAAQWPLENPPTPTFSDVAIGSTFYEYVETAVCHGIITGYADGTFRPGNNATRAQISKIVCLAVRDKGAC